MKYATTPRRAVPCALGCGQVVRVDPDSGLVQATITVPKLPRAFAFGFGALWAEVEVPDDSPAMVVKIDPTTEQVVAQAEIPNILVVGSTGHPRLAVGAGAVWSLYGSELTKIEPESGAVLGRARLDVSSSFDDGIVANATGVWAVGEHLEAIDPASLAVHELASLPLGFIQSATIDGDAIWLTEAHNPPVGGTNPVIELIKVDTATGQVTYTGIPTTNVAAGGGRVWFQGFARLVAVDTEPHDVVEIDPATGKMVRGAKVGIDVLSPPPMAVDERAAWLLTDGGLVRIRA